MIPLIYPVVHIPIQIILRKCVKIKSILPYICLWVCEWGGGGYLCKVIQIIIKFVKYKPND